MSPAHDDDWSDSDDDVGSDVETSVLLGVPDGLVQSQTDIDDAAVSRIGGHPVRAISPMLFFLRVNPLSLRPSANPMDRALYVWGCAKPSCQGKPGSVRAWRGLRRNDKYAAKLEIRLAKKRATEEAKAQTKALAEQQKNISKKNPFSLSAPPAGNIFGIGAQIFGDTPPPPTNPAEPKPNENDDRNDENDDDTNDEESTLSEDELLTAMASVTVTGSPWKAAPSYPPLYLSTVSEYLPPQPKPKVPQGTQVTDPLDDEDRKGSKDKDISWASEPYEDSLEMDHVFERFTKRVAYEGEQYELNGTPLPFSSDKIFASLFPSPSAPTIPVTKGAFAVTNIPKRTYLPMGVPVCPACCGKRVFECQLMPNLINVLRRPSEAGAGKQQTDEERRRTVERALKGGASEGEWGMEWGTSMVFSCERDCCFDENGKEARECWREEVVFIQAAI
ncbi:hypothetical protein C0995_007357 [Termitomyces sp. Mi166|nr:hypothetical protein C0995_007357 [Termitomyces sp. Mi166\